jgi:hypothetical protein
MFKLFGDLLQGEDGRKFHEAIFFFCINCTKAKLKLNTTSKLTNLEVTCYSME